jgi:hypothetical protein
VLQWGGGSFLRLNGIKRLCWHLATGELIKSNDRLSCCKSFHRKAACGYVFQFKTIIVNLKVNLKLWLNHGRHLNSRDSRLGIYSSYSFLTSALDVGEWPALCPGERTPGTHCTGGWVGPRAGLDTEDRKNIPASCPVGNRGPFPGGKARSGRDTDQSSPSSAEVMND